MRLFNTRVVGPLVRLFALMAILFACSSAPAVHAQLNAPVSDGGAPTSGEVVSGGPAWDPPIGTTPIYGGAGDDEPGS